VCAKVITRGGGKGGTRVSAAYQRLLKVLFDNIHSQCSDINSINGSNNNNNQRFISFFNRSSRERRVNITSKRSRKQHLRPRNFRDTFLRLSKISAVFYFPYTLNNSLSIPDNRPSFSTLNGNADAYASFMCRTISSACSFASTYNRLQRRRDCKQSQPTFPL